MNDYRDRGRKLAMLLLISILAFWMPVQAQKQNQQAAELISRWTQTLPSSYSLSSLTAAPGLSSAYLAKLAPTGFALFFVTDQQVDIIGYSLESDFPEDKNHPMLTEWLPLAEPSGPGQLTVPVHPEQSTITARMKGSKTMQDLVVEPLIESKWGQGIPWNKYCPADNNGARAPVGCVAVAMAQVMKKWNWPLRGTGSNSYTPSNYPAYGVQSASFDTLYPWNDMHPTDPADASALLLYHAGVATYMNYGPKESGANTSVFVPPALIDNFKYQRAIQVRDKEQYLENNWFRMLRQELINGRPLIYYGYNPDGGSGHAFNIDGFHSHDYFHFNWGWNGSGNGYFRLENMAAGGDNFTKGQAAIFWAQPNYLPLHDRPGVVQILPGDGFVYLHWDDLFINDFSHYNIYRNGERIGTSIHHEYKDEGLMNGTVYSYQISASYVGDDEGESALTEEIEARPSDAIQLPSLINFENYPDNWEFSNESDGFKWGTAAELGFPENDSHIMAIRSDLGQPGQQVMDYLTAPSLDIRGINHVAVSFDYVFKQNPGVDYLFLMYRRYDNGLWYPISRLDSTGGWDDWKTAWFYFPEAAKYGPIQLGFYYNDFRGNGYGAAIDNIRIWTIEEPPVPDFDLSEEISCQHEIITVSSTSTGNIYAWNWDFGEGATPRFAETAGPHQVNYQTPGPKTVSLLLNHLDKNIKANVLQVHPEPIAGFSYERNGLHVLFTDSSVNASWFWWDFGDGTTSTEKNPDRKYQAFEEFKVTQVVWNEHCQPDTVIQYLDFRINSSSNPVLNTSTLHVYPVPAKDRLFIESEDPLPIQLKIRLYNGSGQLVLSEDELHQQLTVLQLNSLQKGLYYLIITHKDNLINKKIIVE